MIQPRPFKFVCPQCGYSKVVKPKSDALSPLDMMNICPKCQTKMEHKELNAFDLIISIFK